jgi:hypothetical protein
VARARRSPLAGAAPLSPRRKWRAITIATLLLVPCFWAVLAGIASATSDDANAPSPGPLFAFGFSLVPFVFLALAFLSEHPRAPGAVAKALVLAVVVGIPVSAGTDAVTGLVAGLGAGGVAALRADADHNWKARAFAVLAATVYVFVLLRTVGEIALLMAPILPFTGIGVVDHISERRKEREADGT